MSCEPHLINALVKESQAGVLITDEGALLYETAEHLSLDHEGVEPLVGAVSALQETYETKHLMKSNTWMVDIYLAKLLRAFSFYRTQTTGN